MSCNKSFVFDMSNYFTLHVDEIWPDGDAPDNPTVADVWKVIEHCGGKRRVIDEWNLNYGMELTISECPELPKRKATP